jgi:hypothetical protein
LCAFSRRRSDQNPCVVRAQILAVTSSLIARIGEVSGAFTIWLMAPSAQAEFFFHLSG